MEDGCDEGDDEGWLDGCNEGWLESYELGCDDGMARELASSLR